MKQISSFHGPPLIPLKGRARPLCFYTVAVVVMSVPIAVVIVVVVLVDALLQVYNPASQASLS